MILIDTVVLSELRKTRPHSGVVNFLTRHKADALFISVMTVGEIEAGIARQRSKNPEFAAELEQWLIVLEQQFSNSILPVTPAIAKLWGRLCVQTGNKGVDNLIAATALAHNLTIATRNTKHFDPTGARVIDPFKAKSV